MCDENSRLKRSLDARYAAERASCLSALVNPLPPLDADAKVSAHNFDFLSLTKSDKWGVFLRSDGARAEQDAHDGVGGVVLFSGDIYKINKDGLRQRRCFVVTSEAIYNFKSAETCDEGAQRTMRVRNLEGVVRSLSSHKV